MLRLLLSLALLLFLDPGQEQQQFVISGYTQGTDYTVKYYADRPFIKKEALEALLARIDSSMSLYKPYSLINTFNASPRGILIDEQFKTVIRKSFEVYQHTEGRFDVTVAPLVQAWGFGAVKVDHYPDSGEVKKLLPDVGMHLLQLKGNYLKKKKPGVQVDLNGIAQGFSVDVVAGYLDDMQVNSYVVEIGGELRAKGRKPDGSKRRIGIEGPATGPGEEPVLRHIIELGEGAVTTSGNYRKFHQQGAKKITHLIDPKTGYPLDKQMISVTLVAPDAITADAYDNALMAMDVAEALHFVAQRKDLEAYFVYRSTDGRIADTTSSGFKKMIVN